MSLSSDSSMATSSLTDCGNSASDCGSVVSATCKRKRDYDSDMPLLSEMNLALLFHHIIMARYNLPPYQSCSDSWDDEVIWSKIAVAMRSSVVDVLDNVAYYGKLHRDGKLCYVTDEFLRANVRAVVEENSFKESKGCINLEEIFSMKNAVKAKQPPRRLHKTDVHPQPQRYLESSSSECVPTYAEDFSGRNRIIERLQKEKRQKEKEQVQNQLAPHPCTSNQQSYPSLQNMIGYNVCEELGYFGSITMQYSEDRTCG